MAIQNGAVYAWGYNAYGQVGNATTTNQNAPVVVKGLTSGVTAVAGGGCFSLAIQNGSVLAWGDNSLGQLGNGTSGDYSDTPLLVNDLNNIVEVAASAYSSYALGDDGILWAWGDNGPGTLGQGESGSPYLIPIQVPAPNGYRFTSISSNANGFSVVATLAPISESVPEPASLILLGVGLCGLLASRQRG